MIGRAYLWGLAANGQAGVENVLDLLRAGIDACLLGPGHSSISKLSAEDLVISPVHQQARRLIVGIACAWAHDESAIGVSPCLNWPESTW